MKKRYILLLCCCLLLSPWFFALIRCEINTAKYRDDDMLRVVNEYQDWHEYDTLKILDRGQAFAREYCKVYARTRDIGSVFILFREDGDDRWKAIYEDQVWGGTADDFVWPYVWDTIVYLFT